MSAYPFLSVCGCSQFSILVVLRQKKSVTELWLNYYTLQYTLYGIYTHCYTNGGQDLREGHYLT